MPQSEALNQTALVTQDLRFLFHFIPSNMISSICQWIYCLFWLISLESSFGEIPKGRHTDIPISSQWLQSQDDKISRCWKQI